MNPLADRLAALVLDSTPYAYCYACLATKVTVTEKELREAAQLVLQRPSFQTVLRVCYTCGRTDRLLTHTTTPPEKPA